MSVPNLDNKHSLGTTTRHCVLSDDSALISVVVPKTVKDVFLSFSDTCNVSLSDAIRMCISYGIGKLARRSKIMEKRNAGIRERDTESDVREFLQGENREKGCKGIEKENGECTSTQ